jgi:hypothetical protein
MADLNMDRITQALEAEGFAVGLMHTGGGCYSLVITKTTRGPVWIGPFHRDGRPHDPHVYVTCDDIEDQGVLQLAAETIEEVLDDVAMFLTT